jgi:hypothetical protein
MFRLLQLLFGSLIRLFYSRHELLLENLALRQQLAVLKARKRQWRPGGPEADEQRAETARLPNGC